MLSPGEEKREVAKPKQVGRSVEAARPLCHLGRDEHQQAGQTTSPVAAPRSDFLWPKFSVPLAGISPGAGRGAAEAKHEKSPREDQHVCISTLFAKDERFDDEIAMSISSLRIVVTLQVGRGGRSAMMVGRRGRGLAEEGGKVVRAMEGIERENDAINHRKTAGQSGGELCLSTSSQRKWSF